MSAGIFNTCPACARLLDEWISKHEFGETQNAEYIAMSAHHDLCMEHQQWRRRNVGRWIFAPELLEKEYAEIDARIKMIEELHAHSQLSPV